MRIPDRLLVALEAAASVALDHPRGAAPHVIDALTRQPVAGRSPVVARFEELAAAMAGNDDHDGTAAIVALLPDARRHRSPTPLPPGPSSILDAARQAATISRSHTYGNDSDQVGRSLLATWPARAGVLAHIPAPISRSLADAGVRSPSGLAFDDHVSLLVAAVGDAADRTMRAEVELIRLHDRYIAQLEAQGEHRARSIVSLLISDPIVTVDAIVTGFDVSHVGARAGLDELTAAGWLARVDAQDHASPPEWLTIGVLDTLIAAFEEPGSPCTLRSPTPVPSAPLP